MTPEERARSLIGSFYEWMAAGGDYHGTPLLDGWTDAIRAALAERDAEWAKAFNSLVLEGTEPMCRHCSGLLRDALDPCSCKHCRPLRSLLAAGPTTERTE